MLVTMDFPTPPLPDTTPMTRLMALSSWGFSRKLWGSCFLSPQFWLQDPQSWVQPSGVLDILLALLFLFYTVSVSF
jgi:hypothetical protein